MRVPSGKVPEIVPDCVLTEVRYSRSGTPDCVAALLGLSLQCCFRVLPRPAALTSSSASNKDEYEGGWSEDGAPLTSTGCSKGAAESLARTLPEFDVSSSRAGSDGSSEEAE